MKFSELATAEQPFPVPSGLEAIGSGTTDSIDSIGSI